MTSEREAICNELARDYRHWGPVIENYPPHLRTLLEAGHAMAGYIKDRFTPCARDGSECASCELRDARARERELVSAWLFAMLLAALSTAEPPR